jgi:hypothetical protein
MSDGSSRLKTAIERLIAELEGPLDPYSYREKQWAQVPEPIRKEVEQHVAAQLPADLLAKWRDQHARGERVGSDELSFHFGAGMAVRNLCRERLKDSELSAYGLWGEWDDYYRAVLAAIAASPASEQ